jgi:hypothetical protein
MGMPVRFSAPPLPAPGVLYDSGPSDPLPDAWDTVVVQGAMADSSVRLLAARVGDESNWVDFKIAHFPGGRFWGTARLPRASGSLRLQALAQGSPAGREISLYAVEVFSGAEAGGASASAAPPVTRGPMDPAAPAPLIHGRAEWNAAPPTEPPTPDPLPWRLTVHHTDGRYTDSLAGSLAETRFIQNFHQKGRGWIDIGYHYLIDPLGNIMEGRPLETYGAHTGANNQGNVGIVLMGSYHEPKNHFVSPVQFASLVALSRYLVKRFGIDPLEIKGHRDYNKMNTVCPGDQAHPLLDGLRRSVVDPPAVAAPVDAPSWNG